MVVAFRKENESIETESGDGWGIKYWRPRQIVRDNLAGVPNGRFAFEFGTCPRNHPEPSRMAWRVSRMAIGDKVMVCVPGTFPARPRNSR